MLFFYRTALLYTWKVFNIFILFSKKLPLKHSGKRYTKTESFQMIVRSQSISSFKEVFSFQRNYLRSYNGVDFQVSFLGFDLNPNKSIWILKFHGSRNFTLWFTSALFIAFKTAFYKSWYELEDIALVNCSSFMETCHK